MTTHQQQDPSVAACVLVLVFSVGMLLGIFFLPALRALGVW